MDLARMFPDFANTVSPEHARAGRPLFFGFRDSVVDSLDQAARFQRTFSNRAAVMIQGVDEWVASQRESGRIESAVRAEKCRVGIGVYLVQSDSSSGRALVNGLRGSGKVARYPRRRPHGRP
jgi:hypothetical protein